MPRRYWLFKSEPGTFSWDDLEKSEDQTTCWEGVRNYQARNFMRDDVKLGDGVFFYHSRVAPMSIVGKCKVVRESYPDYTQWDESSPYHDPKATKDNPRWMMVDVKADGRFKRPVTLEEMKTVPELADMVLLKKGSRLSIQPVTAEQWKVIVRLSSRKA